jgi:hypothetical protein
LLIDDTTTKQAPPNFIRHFAALLRDANANVTDINQAISVTSFISQSAPGGGTRPSQPITGGAFPYHLGRIPDDNRNTLSVQFILPRQTAEFDRAPLEKFYNAGVPSDRFITSALQPTLRPTNHRLLNNLSGCIEQNWQVYDNSALYVKLLYWALVHDCYTFINVQPVATPFPAGFDPVWLDLDVAEPVIDDYLTAINNKSIIFVEGVDFTRDDWILLFWLAKVGNRLEGPDLAAAPVFHNTYLNWAGVNITVLAHGAPPVAPAPVVLSAERIISFVSKMASLRNEWNSYLNGLYIVLDVLGLRYNELDQMFYPLKTNLSCMNINLPQPADYNFMLRLMKIYPPLNTIDRDEVLAWTALRSVDRVRSAALYTVVLATACTTTLYGLNLTTNSLIMWGMGVDTPPFINEILGSVLNTPNNPQIADKDVAMFSTPKKAFPLWLGCSVADDLYPGSYWLGPYGSEPNIAGSFAGIQGLSTPQLFSPLVCDNWLIVRPIEWGIAAPQPTANFRSEVRR